MFLEVHISGQGSVGDPVARAHAQMAKVDIESAYRIIPVNPTDRLLLGMQ